MEDINGNPIIDAATNITITVTDTDPVNPTSTIKTTLGNLNPDTDSSFFGFIMDSPLVSLTLSATSDVGTFFPTLDLDVVAPAAASAASEPASLTLLGLGVVSLAGVAWRRRKQVP